MTKYDKYQKYQKYINGVPADPPEYMRGELIGTGEYDSIADCESDVLYRWVDNGKTVCKGYSLYNQEKKQKSTDKGVTWTDTNEVRDGNKMIEQYAEECGWRLMERWTSTGVTRCSGGYLLEEYTKEVSYDMGATWQVSNPPEYKYEVKEKWYKNCVLELAPLEFEVTTEEPNVPIWIEIETYGFDRCFINWGESENIAEYAGGYRYIMTDDRYSSYPSAPFSYTYANAGTYTIKLWVNYIKIIGGVWRSITQQNPDEPNHLTQFKYTDKYTYKIKSFGNLPNSNLKGINLSGTPLTELCSDEYGFLGGENFTSCILNEKYITSQAENVRHYRYDYQSAYYGSKDYTVTTLIEQAFDVANTKLTTIPQDLFKYATYMGGVRFANCRIQSIPKELFVNCVGLQSCTESFRETDITDIPEGLFDSCTNLKAASSAFKHSNIVNCPRLWTNYLDNTPYMFEGCEQLESIASTFKVNMGFQPDMFFGCTKLSDPKNIFNDFGDHHNYIISGMYQNSGVTSIPNNLFSLLSSGHSIDASYMFAGCKNLLSMSGTITSQNMNADLHHMFANSGLTNIDLKFPNILTTNNANCLGYMFEGCVDLTTLNTDMFNFNATSLDIVYMFKDCKKLTNWPIAEEHNLWDYPCFYSPDSVPNHIDYQYTFSGCSKIISEIPVEFGGLIMYKGLIPAQITLPITKSTLSYKGLQLRIPANEKAIVRWEDDVYTLYQDENLITLSYTYKTPGDKHIEIYATQNVTIYYTNSIIPVDVNNFGTIKFDLDNNNIRLLGPTNGQYKAETQINLQGGEGFIINPAHFTDCNNVNKFVVTKVAGFTGEFKANDWMPNLTDVTKCFDYSTINSYDGIFEGCQNIIDIRNFCQDLSATGEVTINRLFKGCTSLSTISSGTGSNTDGPFWFGRDKITHTDEAFMNCTSLKKSYTTLGPTPEHYSDVREFCNSGIIKAHIYAPERQINHDVDWTECFKDCKDLTSIFIEEDLSINGTLNMTRMFENCTSLTATPTYKGKKLWEWSGVQDSYGYVMAKQIIGTECFKGCTQLADYNEIPDNWK